MNSSLQELQDAIVERLKEHEELKVYTLLAMHPINCSYILDTLIKSQNGLAIVVDPPLPLKVRGDCPGPIFEILRVCIRIVHKIFTAGLTMSPICVAEEVSRHLHFWSPVINSWNTTLKLSPNNPWVFSNAFPKSKTNVLEMEFQITAHL